MATNHRSFRLSRPVCPVCGSGDVRLARSPGNVLRLLANAFVALFLWPPLDYRWRCTACGRALSTCDVGER